MAKKSGYLKNINNNWKSVWELCEILFKALGTIPV